MLVVVVVFCMNDSAVDFFHTSADEHHLNHSHPWEFIQWGGIACEPENKCNIHNVNLMWTINCQTVKRKKHSFITADVWQGLDNHSAKIFKIYDWCLMCWLLLFDLISVLMKPLKQAQEPNSLLFHRCILLNIMVFIMFFFFFSEKRIILKINICL